MALHKPLPQHEVTRCDWCLGNPLYERYHDLEWGVPVHDDRKLFEFLILEGAQAGLSWITVLRKRESYRKAYKGFDVNEVANFTDLRQAMLLGNTGIIRNKLKIAASVTNARLFLDVQQAYGSFANYIWGFTNGETIVNHPQTMKDIPTTSKESDALSKDLKKKGFKFVGSTIMYAHMQATGMVDDHLESCWRKKH
ncbi:MAG: DNA-3-methyladenine glycosylase I [Bacteroidetes bacterium]|jgi:DNA-3-methyladenine glycosylase I|nr:DNA-3-methyladenine glycosylase I [Bacteroidota bacterium]